jgi:predicted PurR-regulated permease PerM
MAAPLTGMIGSGPAGTDVVPLAVAVVATLVVVALLAGVVAVVRQARVLRSHTEALALEANRLLAALEDTIDVADAHLGRVDELIGSAEQISDAVGSASRLASTAIAAPVIKAMAFGSGAAQAGRRLRQGPPVRR